MAVATVRVRVRVLHFEFLVQNFVSKKSGKKRWGSGY